MRTDPLLFKWMCTILLSLASFVLPAQNSHPDTVLHDAMITPFDLSGEEINFPLGHGKPAGDINNDGYTDMIFNNYRAANEQSPELDDYLPKSVIIYSSAPRAEDQVFYNSRMYGIGDYNGDGFDDVVDIYQKKIKFGCPDGISEDFIQIELPEDHRQLFFAGDINDDGYSEFMLGDYYNDSLLVFSGPDTASFIFPRPNNYWRFEIDETIFYVDDFDQNDSSELCMTMGDWSPDNRMIMLFYFNKDTYEFEIRYSGGYPYLNEPYSCYAQEYTDLNGDGKIDISHVYGDYDSTHTFRFNLEVNFGSDVPPFFDPPVEIVVGNINRFLYHAGDFNGDGTSDWYSKLNDTAMVVYYSSADILTSGMQTVIYPTGNTHYYLPLRWSYSDYSGTTNMQIFDYDQDSIFDLYFDYWKFDENGRYEVIGTATILGGKSPDFNDPIVTGAAAQEAFPELGYGLLSANVGDMNKDGYDDWGVLAHDNCYLDIYFGGSDWEYIPDIKYALPQGNASKCFNWSHGDMNGDGWTDIAISNSSIYSVGGIHSLVSRKDEVMIFLGSPDFQDLYYAEDANYILKGGGNFYEFGRHLSFVGDYNADGFDDLVVGGLSYHNRIAYIYLGGITIQDEPDIIIDNNGTQTFTHFADPITACGDINADGYADFTLADPQYDAGRSLIYYGGPDADNQFDKVLSVEFHNGYSFGSMTARNEGDFDGDGYADLVHFDSYTKEILIYAGGSSFDTIPDYIIHDTNFQRNWSSIDFINMECETGKSSIGRYWTIFPSYSDTNVYDVRIYSIEDTASNTPGIVLWNRLERAGQSYASGDFNNDGLCDIIVGIPYEKNYGNQHGGILYKYTPSLPVSTDDNQMPEEEMVHIFPNPASTDIVIRCSNLESEYAINIYSITGSKIYEDKTQAGSELSVNISTFKPGVYIIVLNNEEGIIERGKFIKY